MRAQPLTVDQANAVYDLLVQHAGAADQPPDGTYSTPRELFVFHQTCGSSDEYRFQGVLGFGGKFWNCNGRWYVTAYPETIKDRPELRQIIDTTNEMLAELRGRAVAAS